MKMKCPILLPSSSEGQTQYAHTHRERDFGSERQCQFSLQEHVEVNNLLRAHFSTLSNYTLPTAKYTMPIYIYIKCWMSLDYEEPIS